MPSLPSNVKTVVLCAMGSYTARRAPGTLEGCGVHGSDLEMTVDGAVQCEILSVVMRAGAIGTLCTAGFAGAGCHEAELRARAEVSPRVTGTECVNRFVWECVYTGSGL
eukprot:scaffold235816_cov46-Tisochrysis_lutea.AAC.2